MTGLACEACDNMMRLEEIRPRLTALADGDDVMAVLGGPEWEETIKCPECGGTAFALVHGPEPDDAEARIRNAIKQATAGRDSLREQTAPGPARDATLSNALYRLRGVYDELRGLREERESALRSYLRAQEDQADGD